MLATLEGLLGLLLAGLTLRDVFDTVVVPGQVRGTLKVSRRLVFLALPLWRGRRGRSGGIGVDFAPTALVASFILWMLLLVAGFGLMVHALGEWFTPPVDGLGQALYIAGSALATIGIGPGDARGAAAVVVVAAGFCGLAVMTMAVTYLLEVQGNIAMRDTGVLKITTAAGHPPSGLALLERYAALGCRDEVAAALRTGRDWCAAVLQSHVSHPSLIYFRSAGTGQGWPAALGALVDVALLVEYVLDEPAAFGAAVLTREQGQRLADDVARLLALEPDPPATPPELVKTLRARLSAAGYRLRPDFDLQRYTAARTRSLAGVGALAGHLGMTQAPLADPSPQQQRSDQDSP
jgi:hypothetical protein